METHCKILGLVRLRVLLEALDNTGELMTTISKIEWTERTWNPIVGCTKISPGCKNCYAEGMARRLQAMGTPGYENEFK